MRRSGDCKRRKSSRLLCKHCDRISEVPDDILISIISRLALKEATATSILSKRWRYLSTYTTHLIFPPQFNPKHFEDDIKTKWRIAKYKNMIDHVLDSHKGGRLKEFTIKVRNLGGVVIGKWIEFALAKEVESIHLDMGRDYSLRHTNLINSGRIIGCGLKELSLSSIDVDDGELELLLRRFPLLESLSIVHSETLRNASIISLPKLRHLEISGGRELELLKIDSLISLISLRCHFLPETHTLVLNNVPNLIEFDTYYQGMFINKVPIMPAMPSTIRDQLEKLKVFWIVWTLYSIPFDYKRLLVQFSGIKHLDLGFVLDNNVTSLFDLFYLIQACSSLEKLEIQVKWRWSELKDKVNEETWIPLKSLPRLELSPKLKRVKLRGFVGIKVELEFARAIMENLEAVEELIVETCEETNKIKALAIKRARHHFRPSILPYPFTLLVI